MVCLLNWGLNLLYGEERTSATTSIPCRVSSSMKWSTGCVECPIEKIPPPGTSPSRYAGRGMIAATSP